MSAEISIELIGNRTLHQSATLQVLPVPIDALIAKRSMAVRTAFFSPECDSVTAFWKAAWLSQGDLQLTRQA